MPELPEAEIMEAFRERRAHAVLSEGWLRQVQKARRLFAFSPCAGGPSRPAAHRSQGSIDRRRHRRALAPIFSVSRAYRAALEQCNGSLKSAFRAMCAPFVAALLMGCAVVAVQETLFTALPLGLRLAVSIAVGILAYGLILIGGK
jgi:hypothetical protein